MSKEYSERPKLRRRLRRGASIQRFILPSETSHVPFEPSRTVAVPLKEFEHIEDPDNNLRDTDKLFDRIMTFLNYSMPERVRKCRWFHSKEQHRTVLGIPVLRPDSMIVYVWTAIITCVDLTYTAFLVPISIAFDQIEAGTKLSWLSITDIVGSSFYIVDVIFEFHVGFIAAYDIKRVLVLRRGLVAENYIRRGGFFVDILSIIAVIPELVGSLMPGASGTAYKVLFFFRLLRLLRVVRLLRGASGISFLTSPISGPLMTLMNTATMYLLNILFTMLVLINLLGCIWWFVAVLEGLENSWVVYAGVNFELEDASDVSQYITSVYFAMTVLTTVGFGDITPQTVAEMIVTIIFMAIGIFYFGYIVNAVAQITTMLSSKAKGAATVREKLEEVDIWTSARHIPESLKEQVRKYYLEVWAPHSGARLDDAAQFNELPVALRAELVLTLAGKALKQSHMLRALDVNLMEHLATFGMPRPLVAGHDLYQEGEQAESFWVLQEGEIHVFRGIHDIGAISAPAVIGQASIFAHVMDDCKTRLHTMRAWTNCSLWQFPGTTFGRILSYHPKILINLAFKYRDHLIILQEKWGEKAPERISRMIKDLGSIAEQIARSEPEVSLKSDSKKSFEVFTEELHKNHDEFMYLSENYDNSDFHSLSADSVLAHDSGRTRENTDSVHIPIGSGNNNDGDQVDTSNTT